MPGIYELQSYYSTYLSLVPSSVIYPLTPYYRKGASPSNAMMNSLLRPVDDYSLQNGPASIKPGNLVSETRITDGDVAPHLGMNPEAELLRDRHLNLLKRLEELRSKIEGHPAHRSERHCDATETVQAREPCKKTAVKKRRTFAFDVPRGVFAASTVDYMTFDNGPYMALLTSKSKDFGRSNLHLSITLDPSNMNYLAVMLLLARLKQTGVADGGLKINFHRHSSVLEATEDDPYVDGFSKSLWQDHSSGVAAIPILVIWKTDLFAPSVKMDSSQSALWGSRAVVQFLGVLVGLYPYDYSKIPIDVMTGLDYWLDAAAKYPKASKKVQGTIAQEMDVRLGKNGSSSYIMGSRASLADFAMWAVIAMQHIDGSGPKLPTNVESWFKACVSLNNFRPILDVLIG